MGKWRVFSLHGDDIVWRLYDTDTEISGLGKMIQLLVCPSGWKLQVYPAGRIGVGTTQIYETLEAAKLAAEILS